jgi:hypothetical protein
MRQNRTRHEARKPIIENELRSRRDDRRLQHRHPINPRSGQEAAVSLDASVQIVSSMSIMTITIEPVLKGVHRRGRVIGRTRWLSICLRDRLGLPFAVSLFSLS